MPEVTVSSGTEGRKHRYAVSKRWGCQVRARMKSNLKFLVGEKWPMNQMERIAKFEGTLYQIRIKSTNPSWWITRSSIRAPRSKQEEGANHWRVARGKRARTSPGTTEPARWDRRDLRHARHVTGRRGNSSNSSYEKASRTQKGSKKEAPLEVEPTAIGQWMPEARRRRRFEAARGRI